MKSTSPSIVFRSSALGLSILGLGAAAFIFGGQVTPIQAQEAMAERQEIRHQFLSNQDYTGKDLGYTRFFRARMKGADFSGADLSEVTFEQVDLSGADFTKAMIGKDSKFYRVTMSGADLEGVDVSGAAFDSVNLRGANLQNSTGWSAVKKTTFAGADLRGADLSGITELCPDCVWTGAVIDESTILPEGLNPETANFAKE